MVNNLKWYKTTSGKIGIFVLVAATLTGIGYLIANSIRKPKQVPSLPDNTPTPEQAVRTDYVSAELPNMGKGCGTVKTSFDKAFDYVKCDGVWWTISKDRKTIPNWKSLEGNKIATDLLNNKYTN